jgi:uncharacterized protein YndB with AHSA1/START domain
MAILNYSTVEVKRVFNTTPEKLFDAIKAGILFSSCGNGKVVNVDFRVGGEFSFSYGSTDKEICSGKFLEITPHSIIRISWPDGSDVKIMFKPETATSTQMHLLHENISSTDMAKEFDGGWRDGINEFSPHVGRTVVIERELKGAVEKVYELFAKPEFFLRVGAVLNTGSADFRIGGKYSYDVTGYADGDFVKGEFTDIVPNRHIVFTWSSLCSAGPTGETLVMIDFAKVDDKTTKVKLTHSGFPNEGTAKDHEGGWKDIFEKF